MNFKRIALILGILSLISIAGLSFVTWRFCDDFYNEKQLQSKGVIEYLYYMFMNWDGRFISLASFIQMTFIKYLNHNLVVFIWSLLFISNGILIYKIIINEINLNWKINNNNIVLLISVIIICLFYGFSTHISETVFFETGGAYMLHTFLGLVWILAYWKIMRDQQKSIIKILFLVFSINIGMLTQNLVICLLVFLLFEGIEYLTLKERGKVYYISLLLTCLLIGVAITSFAPGSLKRASYSTNSFDSNIVNYFKYFYNVSKVFLRASIYLIPLSIFSGFLIFQKLDLNSYVVPYFYKNGLMQFISKIKWLIIAGSSVFPFLFIPNTVSYRSALFFMLFLCIFLIKYTLSILIKLKANQSFGHSKSYYFFLSLVFIFHLIYMSYSFQLGTKYQKFMNNTDKFLLTKKNSTEPVSVIFFILPYKPFVFKSALELFISNDPNYWVNQEWSFYYDIKIIKSK